MERCRPRPGVHDHNDDDYYGCCHCYLPAPILLAAWSLLLVLGLFVLRVLGRSRRAVGFSRLTAGLSMGDAVGPHSLNAREALGAGSFHDCARRLQS